MVGLGDIANIMGRLQGIQTNMQQMQEELAKQTIEATSGAGMVTAKVTGKGELLSVKIDPQAVDPSDLEMLEDLVCAAVNTALTKSQKQMQEQLSEITGGLNIPRSGTHQQDALILQEHACCELRIPDKMAFASLDSPFCARMTAMVAAFCQAH